MVDREGDLVGSVSRTDLLDTEAISVETVHEIAYADVVTITADGTVGDLSRLMIAEEVDHVPVVDGRGRLVGMCTRTDVLKAARRMFVGEQAEQGWAGRLRERIVSSARPHRHGEDRDGDVNL